MSAFAATAALKLAPLIRGGSLAPPAGDAGESAPEFLRSPGALLAVAVLELVLAALLALPRTWRIGAWLSAGTVTALWIYVLSLALHGGDVSRCGCFGRADVPLLPHAALLLAMLLLSLSCVWPQTLLAVERVSKADVTRGNYA